MDAVAATAPEAGVIAAACAAVGLSRAMLGHLASPPPTPEDIEHARAARMTAVVAMVDGLPLDEQPSAAGLTGPLAAALSRLGRGLMRKECESAKRSESGSSCW